MTCVTPMSSSVLIRELKNHMKFTMTTSIDRKSTGTRTSVSVGNTHGVLTDEMKAYSASMSAVRSFVEWLFGDIINYFKV